MSGESTVNLRKKQTNSLRIGRAKKATKRIKESAHRADVMISLADSM